MATRFYKGNTPLLSQPSVGGSLLGRAYIGGQLAYGEAPSVASVITENLVQWLDVTKGTSSGFLADSSGNSNNATDQSNGNFTYNTGTKVWDVAATSNSDYIAPALNPDYVNSWSIEVWGRYVNINGSTNIFIVGNRVSGETPYFGIQVNEQYGTVASYWQANNTLSVQWWAGDEPGFSMFDGNYHQVVVTHDSVANTFNLYVDGAFKVSDDSSGTTSPATSADLAIFGRYSLSQYLDDANLGSYRLYDDALSADDVLNNWDVEKGHYGL